MKKLSKEHLKRKDDLHTKLVDGNTELETAVEKYNQAIRDAYAELEPALVKMNEIVEEAREFVAEVVSEMDDYASEKSDKWHESDGGQAFESWKSEWECFDLSDVEIDEPEEIDSPEVPFDDFMNLPDEKSEG